MSKQFWKPGNMLYPLPAVLVTCQEKDERPNIITVAWTGTICTNPAMLYISVRPERYSYSIIKNSMEFVVNLTTRDMAGATDFCGVRSGRDTDKFKETNLTPQLANIVHVPLIAQSPVNIECKVKEILPLGSHHMFIAEVVGVNVEESLLNQEGKFELNKSDLIVYSHGEYYGLGDLLGNFGYSVRKTKKPKKKSGRGKRLAGHVLGESR